jgi:hypothetical protein
MAALPDADLQARIAASPFRAKYGQTIDRQSAYELITARIAAARVAAQQAAAVPVGVPPTTAGGLNTMSPAEQDREIRRQAREMAAAERERAAAARRARADARANQRMVETGVRTAGRVITSKAGQDLIRGVFGTLFGKR